MHNLDPSKLNLFFEPRDRMRLTIEGDRSYLTVKPVWAAPQSRPNSYLCLLDGKGEEIALVPDADRLSVESRQVVRAAMRQRYLTAIVREVKHVRQEYGATYWTVVTDRGEREFVTQNLQENALWYSDRHLLLVDVDGNRFEVVDLDALDAKSRAFIRAVL